MLLTPHTFVGIALGATIPNINIAVPVSFLMHFAGDLVPHWDFFSGVKSNDEISKGWRPIAVMADLILGVAVGMYFTLHALWLNGNPYLALKIFLCGAAAVLPDAMSAKVIYGNPDKNNGIFGIIYKIQGKLQSSADLPWGIITQILVMLVSYAVISSSLAQ